MAERGRRATGGSRASKPSPPKAGMPKGRRGAPSGRSAGTGRLGGASGAGAASGRGAGGGRSGGGVGWSDRSGPAGRGGGRARGGAQVLPDGRVRPVERGLGGEQVEGRQAVRELLIAGRRKVYEVWISNDLDRSEVIEDIVNLAEAQRIPIVGVSRNRLENQARSEAPQGVLARAAELPEVDMASMTRRRPGHPPFLVAVDGVTDPGNLGALLRCADGAGVGGVVLPRHRTVHVTPTVCKAAAGAVEHVPLAIVPGLPVALKAMRKAGIWVVGLDDEAERTLFELGDLATSGICLVMGAEGAGLSRLVRECCDLIVSIPMLGRLSSLNVSTAAALACYEVARHRQAGPTPAS